jgi:hypothetical protein
VPLCTITLSQCSVVRFRQVYGKRATPYEVLSERMASTFSIEDILPRVATIVAEATGAAHSSARLVLRCWLSTP